MENSEKYALLSAVKHRLVVSVPRCVRVFLFLISAKN